jgi:hypothetical protein
MSTAIQKATTTTTAIERATAELTQTLKGCTMDLLVSLPDLEQVVALAAGYKAMRAALSKEVMEDLFMPLCGMKLGFRTDRDSKPPEQQYNWEIVRECVIDAMIQGARVVGNEFNIIAEQAYFTKEFFERKLAELPELTDIVDDPGMPTVSQNGQSALVAYTVHYIYRGKRGVVKRDLDKDSDGVVTDKRIPVRVNAGQGPDAILGKAKRKIYAQLYKRLTGSKITDGDIIDTTGESVPDLAKPPNAQKPGTDQQAEDLVAKHAKQAAEKKNGASKAGQATLPVDGKPSDPAADSSGHPEPGSDG